MRLGTKLIWIVFGFLLVAVAVWQNTGDRGDGSACCAMMGFGMLIVLLVGTWFERKSRRDDD